jgi:hypothetical protein
MSPALAFSTRLGAAGCLAASGFIHAERIICRQQSALISDLQGPGMQLCIAVQLNR